jgi:hypothetical protein
MHRDNTAPDTIHVSSQWLADHGIDPANVCSYRLQDDSLEPEILRGSDLIIDTGDTTVVSGRYYAVEQNGEFSIRKLDSDIDGIVHGCVVRAHSPLLRSAQATGAMLKQAHRQVSELTRAIEQV